MDMPDVVGEFEVWSSPGDRVVTVESWPIMNNHAFVMCLHVDIGGINPVEPRMAPEVDVPTAPLHSGALEHPEQVTSDSKESLKIFLIFPAHFKSFRPPHILSSGSLV